MTYWVETCRPDIYTVVNNSEVCHPRCVFKLSPIENQMRGAHTHEHIAKTPEADQSPPGTEAPKKKKKMPE